MGYNRSLRDSDSQFGVPKTQLAVLSIIICLSIDAINPVKIVLHVFPQIAAWHVALLCALLMTYLVVTEVKPLLYFSVKVFFNSILSIVFREVQMIGLENVPQYGPVIFAANHANQFVDGITMLCTCQRTISFMIAEKSWNRPIIGHLAWALGAVPVKRAQDSATSGTGQVMVVGLPFSSGEQDHFSKKMANRENEPKTMLIHGFETCFSSQIKMKDKIRLAGLSSPLAVQQIISDAELRIEVYEPFPPASVEKVSFDILKHVDQGKLYDAVLNKLGTDGCIGIFPEGGSHDRSDLLPLKVGVALIAYEAFDRDGVNIPIVPVGLNYVKATRFGGRAIVEFGAPLFIDPNTLDSFKQGGRAKREVCNNLLSRIQDSMRSVIVTAPDYESLKFVHTCRRLFQQEEMSVAEKQDLARRFSESYRRLKAQSNGNPPKEWADMHDSIVRYQNELEKLGIRDYQVPELKHEEDDTVGDTILRVMRVPFQIMVLLFVMALALVPGLLLNYPVGLMARFRAERRRKKALAESTVKIRGQDVILSEKVMFALLSCHPSGVFMPSFSLVFSIWMVLPLLSVFFQCPYFPMLALG